MKKLHLFKLIFTMTALLACRLAMAQASGQFAIGDGRNQTATNIKALPDGSGSIIAGYEYDIKNGDVQNAMMVLMKVNAAGTAILWQERVGIYGKNNLVQNMIITHDGNVVIVGTMGRDAVYANNIAAIMKFKSSDGSLMWQGNMQDPTNTVGGEIFYGVTELGAALNYDLVAVGSHDSRPGAGDAMVAVYHSNGILAYAENWGVPNSDGYLSVCTAPNGIDAYICGTLLGNYTDVRIDYYHPYATATSGNIVWARQMDFVLPGVVIKNDSVTPGTLNLQNNFFANIYHTGTKLLIHGGSLNNYTFTGGEGESICRMNDDGSGTAELWQIQNNNMNYANISKIAIVNSDHLFNIQMPASSYIDPIIWLTGAAADAVVTEVTSLTGTGPYIGSHSTIKKPMKLTTPSGGIHSLFDIDLANSNTRLVMAGSTTDTKNNGNNDMYLVTSPTTPATSNTTLPKHDCDELCTGGCLQVAITPRTAAYTRVDIPVTFIDVKPEPIQYRITPLCQARVQCADSSDLSVVSSTDADGNCVFTVTASVGTAGTVKGYEWTLPGGIVQVYTSATSNTQVITLPSGGIFTVSVRIVLVSDYWDEGNSPCCDIKLSKDLTCRKVDCNHVPAPIVTASSDFDADGNCNPTYSSSVYPVTIDFMANVSSFSPYWSCGAFPGSKIISGPNTFIDPCDIDSASWDSTACVPYAAYPCPLSSPTTTHINYMIATTVTYMGCKFRISVPIDPNCAGARPAGNGSNAANEVAGVSVSPNPTDGMITVAGMLKDVNNKEVLLEIVDVLGKTLLTEKCAVNNGAINKKIALGNNIANGTYMVKISGGKQNQTIRFTLNR